MVNQGLLLLGLSGYVVALVLGLVVELVQGGRRV